MVSNEGIRVTQVGRIPLDWSIPTCIGNGGSIDLLKVDAEDYKYEVSQGPDAPRRGKPLVSGESDVQHIPGCMRVFRYLRHRGYRCVYFILGAPVFLNGDEIEAAQRPDDLTHRQTG